MTQEHCRGEEGGRMKPSQEVRGVRGKTETSSYPNHINSETGEDCAYMLVRTHTCTWEHACTHRLILVHIHTLTHLHASSSFAFPTRELKALAHICYFKRWCRKSLTLKCLQRYFHWRSQEVKHIFYMPKLRFQ